MKANKRVRDLRRRSKTRLVYYSREFNGLMGTTTFPQVAMTIVRFMGGKYREVERPDNGVRRVAR